MFRRTLALLLGMSLLVVNSTVDAQEKNARNLDELLAKFPTPSKKDGKLAEVDKDATDAAIAVFLKDPEGSMVGLVERLGKKDNTQVEHALHAIVMHVGGDQKGTLRPAVARALAQTLEADRPREVQAFVVRQLQLVGTPKEAPALGKKLLDADLAEAAAQALLAIGTDAAEQFRTALPRASGQQRLLIVHGLGTLKDKQAAEALRPLLDDKDRDTRLTAAWALARLPDADAAERLLKLADAASGYERDNATDSCLLLAENLLAADDKAGARRIYSRLHESRTDDAERHVREAAARGLTATK